MYGTIHPSDLYFHIVKVYHKSEKYVKCKMLFFYKSNNDICYWLNPGGRAKTYKINRNAFDNYVRYNP
jgi:hypothetical protein